MTAIDDRRALYRAARTPGFPRLRISAWETVTAGEPAWRTFCQRAEPAQVVRAAAALAVARPAGAEGEPS